MATGQEHVPVALQQASDNDNAMAFHVFREIVAGRTGIVLPDSDEPKLRRLLDERFAASGLHSLAEYCRLLRRVDIEAAGEWEALASVITVAETYFFRDEALFQLLRNHILPSLIRHNAERRTLALWCAGCSTGEEAYSLAMLVDQLLPAAAGWHVTLLGTDLNPRAIARAKMGVYPAWSVSRSREPLLWRYCHGSGEKWVVDQRIREMVRFHSGNLVADPLSALTYGIGAMDLILCRNVFIYFAQAAVVQVLDKLVTALRPDGYLLTAPGDLPGIKNRDLRSLLFPEAVAYQRTLLPPLPVAPLPVSTIPLWWASAEMSRTCPGAEVAVKPQTPRVQTPFPDPKVILDEAEQAFAEGVYSQAIAKATDLLALAPRHLLAHCLVAWAYANQGDMDRAEQWAQQAIGIDILAPSPLYLLAQLRVAQADHVQAVALLTKVIYLAPHFIPAYLDLAAIYAAEGQADKARRKRCVAQEMIRAMRGAPPVEPYVALRCDDWPGEQSRGPQRQAVDAASSEAVRPWR